MAESKRAALSKDYPERTGFPQRKQGHCCRSWSATDARGIVPCWLLCPCGASVVTARDAVANRTEIPMKPTDTQLVLLSAASRREDGGIELAPNLKCGAAHKVVGKLLSEGWSKKSPRAARCRSGAVTMRKEHWRCTSPRVALPLSGSTKAVRRRRPRNHAIPSKTPISDLTSLPGGRLRVARRPGARLRNALPHRAGGIR